MSGRERWIVYPLLFLTLGIALRGKLWPQKEFDAGKITAYQEITARKIRCSQLEVGRAECGQLTVTQPDGNDAVRIGAVPGRGGWLEFCGTDGQKVAVAGADATGKAGVVETLGADGFPEVQLRSTRTGGVVTTVRKDRKIWLVMGYQGQHYGGFAVSPEMGRGMLLTLPWRFDSTPPPRRQSPKIPQGRSASGPKTESSDQQPPKQPDE